MALISCPECKTQISDRAVACPHCGYCSSQHADFRAATPTSPPPLPIHTSKCASCGSAVSTNATKCEFCGALHAPDRSRDEESADVEFSDHALQVVGMCERALQSPRMLVGASLADAKNQLARLQMRYRILLASQRYNRVSNYLVECVNRVKAAKEFDDTALNHSRRGGSFGWILGLPSTQLKLEEIEKANAYITDLRIMLGAQSGIPNAVELLEKTSSDIGGNSTKPPRLIEPNYSNELSLWIKKWRFKALIILSLIIFLPLIVFFLKAPTHSKAHEQAIKRFESLTTTVRL